MAFFDRADPRDIFPQGRRGFQRDIARTCAVAAAARAAARRDPRFKSNAGPFYPCAAQPGRADVRCLFHIPGSDGRALRAGSGNHWRIDGIRAAGGAADSSLNHRGRRSADELSALAGAGGLSGRVALDSGLCVLAANHGQKHGTASLGGDFRRDGRRRSCRHSRHLSFDSRDGQPAHRLPACALVCGEEKVWSAQ